MIDISFVKEVPQDPFVYCIASEEECYLPLPLQEAYKKKPFANLVETISSEGRYIGVKLKENTQKDREEAGATLFQKATEGIEEILLLDCRNRDQEGLDLLTGMLLSSFRFDRYRQIKPSEHIWLRQIIVLSSKPDYLRACFEKIKPAIQGVFYARLLTSEPPNILYPEAYARRLQELQGLGIRVDILNSQDLDALGMTGILAVGKGSSQPPAAVVLQWQGQKEMQPIAIIGKGVCFDSGGLCLKSPKHQIHMKWDKAGAGVVAGLLKALALSKFSGSVVGIIGLAENMPDGAATKPGDVIQTMSGQTVEIVDTDAEGRLILADCLWYAKKRFNPSLMIDLGTLTIETFATLGNVYAGLYSNDRNLIQALKVAGNTSGDLLWELPMGQYFARQIESSIADMKNLGVEMCGENGAAAEFLKRFIGDTSWAHIDISGVSWEFEDSQSRKGVTGFGVRLLYEWLNHENASIF